MQAKYALLLMVLVPGMAWGADLPEPVLPQGVGVNIHFTRDHGNDLDLIAAAGFKVIRMDFVWAGIERKKGEYDWSAYDALTTDLEKRGLRPSTFSTTPTVCMRKARLRRTGRRASPLSPAGPGPPPSISRDGEHLGDLERA